MSFNKLQNNRAFTLVETLVAVSILVIGSLGPLVIAAQGISSAGYAKDQIVAYYLAQEGIEFIRNFRDSNAIQGYVISDRLDPTGHYWLTGLDPICFDDSVDQSGAGCRTDAKTSIKYDCSSDTGGKCKALTTDNNGYYGYSGSNKTSYIRTIKLLPSNTSPNNDGIRTVLVTVDWSSHGNPRTFSLSEDIYNSN